MQVEVNFWLNGKPVSVKVAPAKSLLRVLREDLGVTSLKPGCEVGECGACTVLLDGAPVTSCLVLAVQVRGRRVETVEGIDGRILEPLKRAFLEEGAVQCGYCTPGVIVTSSYIVREALRNGRTLTPEDIVVGLSGNLCRCGTYPRVVRAIMRTYSELASVR